MIFGGNSKLTPYFSNYNGLGNQDQQGYDELKYISSLAPLLTAGGFPAHFIVVSNAVHPNPHKKGSLLMKETL